MGGLPQICRRVEIRDSVEFPGLTGTGTVVAVGKVLAAVELDAGGEVHLNAFGRSDSWRYIR